MSTSIYIYFPAGEKGASRNDLEDDLEDDFFGSAAEFVGSGSGLAGSNLDFELADDQDVDEWVTKLRVFLKEREVRPSTFFEVFDDEWEPGRPWLRVDVFGNTHLLTERE
jgi:hypothetical protein